MTSPAFQIISLTEKMTSSDKDYRFMAANDLLGMLSSQQSLRIDDETERRMVAQVLRLLEDKNTEVQNLAVKCLTALTKQVKETLAEHIVVTLCDGMTASDSKGELRGISSVGLMSVVSDPPSVFQLTKKIYLIIAERLTDIIAKNGHVTADALDILKKMLGSHGGALETHHDAILRCILPLLSSSDMVVRKRALNALSFLVVSCSDAMFADIMQFLLDELSANKSLSSTCTYVQCVGAISRQAGQRAGRYLDRLVPMLVQFSENDEMDSDELREHCLQAFESFVRPCPREVTACLPKIIERCLALLCHDPNYNYGSDTEEEDTMETDDMEDDDEEEEDYSDDDDMSWKVRRAAAKCLTAVLGTRPDMVREFYESVSPRLIARFKEREENVKVDIFAAYIALLSATRLWQRGTSQASDSSAEGGALVVLQSQTADLVKAVHHQLKDKSVKTRQGCFALLSELVHVLPGVLSPHMGELVPGIRYCLTDTKYSSSSNMKIDTLSFLHLLLTTHPACVFHPHMETLVAPVILAIRDPFYKISSEALGVAEELVKVLRPFSDKSSSFDFQPFVSPLYECTLERLKAADIDQEVKEHVIATMAQLLHQMGDAVSSQLSVCLPIYVERLRNEITRLCAVRALTLIAQSPLHLDLSIILKDTVTLLSTFLRKKMRSLRLASLQALEVIVSKYSSGMTDGMLSEILEEVPALLNESDLHVAQLSLSLLTAVALLQPAAVNKVHEDVMRRVSSLLQSPLLQGTALHAMTTFLRALVKSGQFKMSFSDLLHSLTSPIYTSTAQGGLVVHKQAFHSLAHCIAALVKECPDQTMTLCSQFVKDVGSAKSSDSVRLFTLLTLGEIGKNTDLSALPTLEEAILQSFSSPSEDVKTAASFALGLVSAGNLAKFFPFILNEMEAKSRRQYLLLHALKETIAFLSSSPEGVATLQPFVQQMWTLLFDHCESKEEGTRNMVAECLGKLTLVDPEKLLPILQGQLSSASSSVARATVVTAVRFTISDQEQAIDGLLRVCIGDFLQTLQDPDLNVRRVALVTFNSAAHNKPSLILGRLDDILPHLYAETKTRKELIHEVEMGPFKHTVDDGLDVRKAAFECMYTLLDTCLERLDIFAFLSHVEDGLRDHYDIKMVTYLMLVRLAQKAPHALLQRLSSLVEPLKATISAKMKSNAVKQEVEKQDELKRSALRSVIALSSIPESDKNPQLAEFLSHLRCNIDTNAMLESLKRDSSTAEPMEVN